MGSKQPTAKYLALKASLLAVLCGALIFLLIGEEWHKPVKAKIKTREVPALSHGSGEALVKAEPHGAIRPKSEEAEKPVRKKTIFLTFDDGPSASTEQLLDVLGKYDVPATFFMLEPNMKKHSKEVQKTIQLGHTAGLHGVSHDPRKYYASPESAAGEMRAANETLQVLTGVSTSIVRTPYGSMPNLTKPEQEALLAAGFTYWDWNVDSFDWKYKNSGFVDDVLEQTEKRTRDFPDEPVVILMHDRPASPEALDQLIPELKERGYSFASIKEGMKPVHLK